MYHYVVVVLTGADGHEGEDDSADDEGDEVDGEVVALEVQPLLVPPRLGARHRRLVLVRRRILVHGIFFGLDGSDVGDEAEEQELQDEKRRLGWP